MKERQRFTPWQKARVECVSIGGKSPVVVFQLGKLVNDKIPTYV